MNSRETKDKIIAYYDQEAMSYGDLYTVPYEDQEFYPANAVRLELIIEILRARQATKLLDIGCGTGRPLLRFLELGLDAYGLDFSPKMVEYARQFLESESHDPDRVSEADIEQRSTLPDGKFDAIVATGVFPHNLNEAAALTNLRDLMADDGVALIEFRNALLSLFSLNRYSEPFYWNDLIGGENLPEPLRSATRAFLEEKFDTVGASVGKQRAIEYTDILARFHNPLTLGEQLAQFGLKLQKIHFYHYHAAPPHLEKKHRAQFWQSSLKQERNGDWRAMFMCSAFVAEITR